MCCVLNFGLSEFRNPTTFFMIILEYYQYYSHTVIPILGASNPYILHNFQYIVFVFNLSRQFCYFCLVYSCLSLYIIYNYFHYVFFLKKIIIVAFVPSACSSATNLNPFVLSWWIQSEDIGKFWHYSPCLQFLSGIDLKSVKRSIFTVFFILFSFMFHFH